MGKRKKHEEPVSLPNAHLPGREYAEDRPDNCRDCFFWKKSTGSCTRYECFFLRPLRKKIEESFFARSVKKLKNDSMRTES